MVKVCNTAFVKNDKEPYKTIFEKYPFELDNFQKYAIQAIEESNHILITAHTGSGKTLPAEYAIQKFCSDGKKVIYTSPIKSLSNQKFHEFSAKFPEISFGILTGDIKFNPEADCLIMTTEILRNTLFQQEMIEKGTIEKDKLSMHFSMDINTELACVIFDEIHYINDAGRGKVWEETIIKLPKQVQMVMLSATIDKAETFAGWIENIKETPVWLAPTSIRVVPLTHYSYYSVHPSQYKKIKDTKKTDLLHSIDDKIIALKKPGEPLEFNAFNNVSKMDSYMRKYRHFTRNNYILNKVVNKLHSENMLPAICFVFSRKKAEEYAKNIETSLFGEGEEHIPNIIQKECTEILRKLPNYAEYINLPEFTMMTSLLEKGIAVHHSGIMPVLREMVELLFSKGYIKLLFATETFAVGINMPTKTVIFTSLKKFDGSAFRNLYSNEYTQMAGRAGRRGLDTIGHVIHLNNMFEVPYQCEYNALFSSIPQTLRSKFSVNFNLLLRLISTKETNFNEFTERSMLHAEIMAEQAINESTYGHFNEKIDILTRDLRSFNADMEALKKYYDLNAVYNLMNSSKRKQRGKLERQMRSIEDNSTRHFKRDYNYYKEIKYLENEKTEYVVKIHEANSILEQDIIHVLDILKRTGFINMVENDIDVVNTGAASEPTGLLLPSQYKLTSTGEIATHIQEVNCLAWADIIESGVLQNVSPQELVAILSSFTTIRVPEGCRNEVCMSENDNVKNVLGQLKNTYNKYYDIELREFKQVTEDDYKFHYDMTDIMMEWCAATTETECKKVLGMAYDKDIFLGEFVKAVLKINTIVGELDKICDLIGNVPLKNVLSQVGDITLKYVATNQSLYV